MTPFTFVHAADLHLDAPFRGINAALASDTGKGREALRALFETASFAALDRIIELCLAVRADFLLLAGDVYNAALGSLRARLALRDAFVKLQSAGIAVFIVHGNHDPLGEGMGGIPWPDNTTVFGPEMEIRPVFRGSEMLAQIHGISHTSDKEDRTLAKFFSRAAREEGKADAFQIGLLHCSLEGAAGQGHARYAPCSVGDLARAGLDYWALGHVHAPQFIGQHGTAAQHPFIVYPGSAQGMHVNETGPHGCVVTRVDQNGVASPRLVSLAAVQWEAVTVALDDARLPTSPDSIVDLETLVVSRLGEIAADAAAERAKATALCGRVWPVPAVAVRLTISGRTHLDHELRRPGAIDALREHMEQELSNVWIRDIIIATRPLTDLAAIALRPDLAGETVRAADALLADAGALSLTGRDALAPLFQRPRMRALFAELNETSGPDGYNGPGDAELAALMEEAKLLCLDLLEGE